MPGKQVAGPVVPVVDNSPISKNRMIPEILEKGVMMKKISAGKEKKVLLQIDPDQGTIKICKSINNNLRISTALSFELKKQLTAVKYP
jgi:predicted nucleotide-binding protein (sugar kinase/HSP70/actin superfamily)